MVYKYEYKATWYKVPAQEAGEYIATISEKEGGITPGRLLDVSRDESALLHDCFEWDDTIAAEKHRLSQARLFLCNLVCVKVEENAPEETKPVRAFVNVMPAEHAKGNFKPLLKALTDDEERQIILNNAKRDAMIFENKYHFLEELADVFAAMDEFIGA